MSVFESKDFDSNTPINCDHCEKSVHKWIDINGIHLCNKCAQMMMRRLMEDLIEYNNPGKKHISLVGIMQHGNGSD